MGLSFQLGTKIFQIYKKQEDKCASDSWWDREALWADCLLLRHLLVILSLLSQRTVTRTLKKL